MRTTAGTDYQALMMSGNVTGDSGTTSGAPTATTAPDTTKSWTVNAWAGKVVVMSGVYGVILSNTSNTLTIDRWYSLATPQGAAAGTPASGAYSIVPASPSLWWIALSTNASAPAAGDTTLAGELASAGGGLNRAAATYAHTAGVASYTLTKTYTANSNDGTSNTIEKIGVFNASSAGTMFFETAVPNPPTLVPGDQITVTETVNI